MAMPIANRVKVISHTSTACNRPSARMSRTLAVKQAAEASISQRPRAWCDAERGGGRDAVVVVVMAWKAPRRRGYEKTAPIKARLRKERGLMIRSAPALHTTTLRHANCAPERSFM